MTRVSILTPAYKAERFLPQTLESIAEQSFDDWELIVVEDGAHDQSSAIVEAFAEQQKQSVKLLRNPQNQGVGRARNQLIEAAGGDYVAWIDADDLWEPDHLENALACIEQQDGDWFISGLDRINPQNEVIKAGSLPPLTPMKDLPNALLDDNFILTSGTVLRREVFDQGLRFNPDFKVGEDLDLYFQLVKRGKRPAFSQKVTLHYRIYPESTTGDYVRFCEEYSKVFEKYVDDPIVDHKACMFGVVKMLLLTATLTWKSDPKRARAALKRLFRHKPLHPIAWRLYIQTWLGSLYPQRSSGHQH